MLRYAYQAAARTCTQLLLPPNMYVSGAEVGVTSALARRRSIADSIVSPSSVTVISGARVGRGQRAGQAAALTVPGAKRAGRRSRRLPSAAAAVSSPALPCFGRVRRSSRGGRGRAGPRPAATATCRSTCAPAQPIEIRELRDPTLYPTLTLPQHLRARTAHRAVSLHSQTLTTDYALQQRSRSVAVG